MVFDHWATFDEPLNYICTHVLLIHSSDCPAKIHWTPVRGQALCRCWGCRAEEDRAPAAEAVSAPLIVIVYPSWRSPADNACPGQRHPASQCLRVFSGRDMLGLCTGESLSTQRGKLVNQYLSVLVLMWDDVRYALYELSQQNRATVLESTAGMLLMFPLLSLLLASSTAHRASWNHF